VATHFLPCGSGRACEAAGAFPCRSALNASSAASGGQRGWAGVKKSIMSLMWPERQAL